MAISIDQQDTLNSPQSYYPGPKLRYQNLVLTVTVTLKEKKNQLHHLDPKFGNQMEHSPCSLFPYLEFWEPPKP